MAIAVAALPAQHEPDPEAPRLRAAFASRTPNAPPRPLLAIAVIGDHEPVTLVAGNDAAGEAADVATAVPIGPLVRMLLADALAIDKDRAGTLVGARIGSRALDVEQLIAGVEQMPDYHDYDGGPPLDAALLLRCAEVFTAANDTPFVTAAGAGELLVLEPALFGDGARDWAAWLRTRLAPHVSSFAPLAADGIGDDAPRTLQLAAAPVRTAQPSALRLLLAGKDLRDWWCWKVRSQDARKGARLDGETTNPARPGTTWSQCEHAGGPCAFATSTITGQRAGLLLLGFDRASVQALRAAFDADVLGPDPAGRIGFGGRFGGRAIERPVPPLRDFVGTWATAAGSPPCTIEVADGDAKALRIAWGDRSATSQWAQRSRDHVRVGLGEVDGLPNLLLLVPGPAGEPRRCTAVLQERRTGVAMPHCFELVRKED